MVSTNPVTGQSRTLSFTDPVGVAVD